MDETIVDDTLGKVVIEPTQDTLVIGGGDSQTENISPTVISETPSDNPVLVAMGAGASVVGERLVLLIEKVSSPGDGFNTTIDVCQTWVFAQYPCSKKCLPGLQILDSWNTYFPSLYDWVFYLA